MFLGIAETWTALSLNQDLVETVIKAHFRKSTRLAAVVMVWRETVTRIGVVIRSKTLLNEGLALKPDFVHLLSGFEVAPDHRWTSLEAIVQEVVRGG